MIPRAFGLGLLVILLVALSVAAFQVGGKLPGSRFTAARPSSTSAPRACTGGWRATPGSSVS
jgi:hypothetical protein